MKAKLIKVNKFPLAYLQIYNSAVLITYCNPAKPRCIQHFAGQIPQEVSLRIQEICCCLQTAGDCDSSPLLCMLFLKICHVCFTECLSVYVCEKRPSGSSSTTERQPWDQNLLSWQNRCCWLDENKPTTVSIVVLALLTQWKRAEQFLFVPQKANNESFLDLLLKYWL